jgi:vacuolar-type H+-ATPase subunit I/STV1
MQGEKVRMKLEQSEHRVGGLDEAAKSAEVEKTQLRAEIAHLRDAVATLEGRRAEDDAQIAKLAKDRKKLELAKHRTDQKLQSVESEKRQFAERIAALENDRSPERAGSSSSVFPDYIRKVLLQFFIQDGSTRDALIPVILAIVQCDQKQIGQAMRCWTGSNQIISHAFSFFGKG